MAFRIVGRLPSLIYGESTYAIYGCRLITFNKFLDRRDKFEVDGKITGIAKISVRSVFKCISVISLL